MEENKIEKIKEAVKILFGNGYVVIKLSKAQLSDSEECDKLEGDKDCDGCSCSCCLFE